MEKKKKKMFVFPKYIAKTVLLKVAKRNKIKIRY